MKKNILNLETIGISLALIAIISISIFLLQSSEIFHKIPWAFFMFLFLLSMVLSFIGLVIGIMTWRNKKGKACIILGLIPLIMFGLVSLIYLPSDPPDYPPTPFMSLSAESSGENCTVTVGVPSISDIEWADTWYQIVNLSSSGQTSQSSRIILPRSGVISQGNSIKIIGDLHKESEYRFALYYNVTGGTMSVVTWVQ